MAAQIEERLASFQVLLPEFVWLFCRLCGQSIEKPGEVTVHELATLMVLRAHLFKQLKMARSSNAGPNQATSALNPVDESLLPTPSGVGLKGVTALSDGTVVAVGTTSNNNAVILHN